MVLIYVVMGILFVGFPVYALIAFVFPWRRKWYIARNTQMKEECEKAIVHFAKGQVSQEFIQALAACSVANYLLPEMFEKSIQAHEKTQRYLSAGYIGMIPQHFSGEFVRGLGISRETDRLISEWKRNKKIIKHMENYEVGKLDGILLEAYNDLQTGEEQIEAIKAWRRMEHAKIRAEERARFFKRATFVGVGIVALVGAFKLMANNSMKDFGGAPNSARTKVQLRDDAGNLLKEYEE